MNNPLYKTMSFPLFWCKISFLLWVVDSRRWEQFLFFKFESENNIHMWQNFSLWKCAKWKMGSLRSLFYPLSQVPFPELITAIASSVAFQKMQTVYLRIYAPCVSHLILFSEMFLCLRWESSPIVSIAIYHHISLFKVLAGLVMLYSELFTWKSFKNSSLGIRTAI